MSPDLPEVRGRLSRARALADLTWLRVGGPADWLFQPADADDLAAFLAALDPAIPVFPIGVGSNLIVRDGGIEGVVVRLGRGFNAIDVAGTRVTAGAAALDAHVARRAAEAGVDLTFLRTIPGAMGGAVRMNAGCYGSYLADVFVTARAVTRAGRTVDLSADDLGFAYRHTDLPADWIVTEVVLEGPPGDSDDLAARMDDAARRPRREPAHEGAQRRLHLPQPGRVLLDRARRRQPRAQGLEPDRPRRFARRHPRRRADERETPQLPDQHRRRDGRRSGGAGREGS